MSEFLHWTFERPYSGDDILFDSYIAGAWSGQAVRAHRSEGRLQFEVYADPPRPLDSEELAGRVRKTVEDCMAFCEKRIRVLNAEVEKHNKRVAEEVQRQVEERCGAQRAAESLAERIGFPLARREVPPKPGDLPALRKKRPAPAQPVPPSPSGPEHVVPDNEYEEILSLVTAMGKAIERTPDTYAGWQEEDFRNLFLVVLNALYQGGATGETFSNRGRSDILIQDGGQVLFVAECKIWDGKAEFCEAIGQLFGYCTWRDTKTAVLIFSRNKNHSRVLRMIETVLRKHERTVKQMDYPEELGTRWRMRHPDDADRGLLLTTLAFPIPPSKPLRAST